MENMDKANKNMHILMYPWFALGHITSFLHISNKFAERGHKVSFLIPTKTLTNFKPLNLHPHLITFIPVVVPHVEGLPPASETTADIPFPLQPLLMAAMDLTQPTIEAHLRRLNPHLVVFDFAHWLPELARASGIKTLHYCTVSAATIGYLLSPARGPTSDLREPPPGFPPSKIKLKTHEAQELASIHVKGDKHGGVSFQERMLTSLTNCDTIGFKACREVEGPYCDYLEEQFKKAVILAGPVLPEPPTTGIEARWQEWLDGFKPKSVVYSAFGSECVLGKQQFQELVLGLELTGMPFLAALKPPRGAETVDDALPEGVKERMKGRGVVYGGWVQQQLILSHPSIGCFATHCGSGSLLEAMVTECQLVLIPDKGDQIINARMMGGDLRVGVEVEKGDEDGEFSREGVCMAVKSVMDEDSEIGKEVRANHDKNRELLLRDGFERSYFNGFVQKLQELVK